MTDLMLRPEDTGEIPTGTGTHAFACDCDRCAERSAPSVGERTENLQPYLHLPPALRRPTVVLTLIEGHQRIVPDGEDILRPGDPGYLAPAPANPTTLPPDPTPPPTPADALWEAEPVPAYAGRHRRASRWDWLTVPLSAAVQRIRAAL